MTTLQFTDDQRKLLEILRESLPSSSSTVDDVFIAVTNGELSSVMSIPQGSTMVPIATDADDGTIFERTRF